MSGIIEGYSYDIFISYRQNDNKYDGWVTEFVNNLNKELEANIKDKVSVYFDINPQDGLLETDSVDKSLENKLKCLIFIPIISRTYCDSKSFAWQHEFCAFNKLAREDKFGRDIKLSSGNVTSRVLPVKIHDLDTEDKTLLENELGGVLRSIEFIYKSAGVNRPLRTNEDHPQDNLNKTYYRDQINKVANAVKEIISALKKQSQHPEETTKQDIGVKSANKKNHLVKIIAGSFMVLVLIILGFFFIPGVFKAGKDIEKSIAVLPFINDSPDQENTYFINGIMDDILNNLQTIKDLRVISRTSVEQYRNTIKSIPEIAKELGVNYLVEGSGQKSGNTINLSVQLLRAAKEGHLWGNSYEQEIHNAKEIFDIQRQISEAIASELKAVITPKEKELIEKLPTINLTAYDAWLKGYYFLQKFNPYDSDSAMKYFELAKEIDPKYALAYAGISLLWQNRLSWGSVSIAEGGIKSVETIKKALELDSTSAEVQYSYGCVNLVTLWDWKESESAYKKSIELNPNLAVAHAWYSSILYSLGRNEEALKQIKIALKLDPKNPNIILNYATVLFFNHQYDDALKTIDEVFKVDKTYFSALFYRPYILHMAGRYDEAFKAFKVFYADNYLKDYDHAFDKGFAKGGYANALRMEADTLSSQVNLKKAQHFLYSDLAMLYVLGGAREKALTFLEIAFREQDPMMPSLLSPIFDSLRNEPRFQEIARKMNLPYK